MKLASGRKGAAVACWLLLLASAVQAQGGAGSANEPTGTLRGRVVDAQSGKPLPYTNVAFYRILDPVKFPDGFASGGVLSQKDGSFTKQVPAGTYRVLARYVSYQTATVADVVVRPGETTDITASLTPAPLQAKAVKVEGQRVRDKETALLAQRQRAETVSDAISSEQIARSTDGNAAEALGRVTGISVVEGKYVFVRGLGERYSSTQVNGSSVGTPEPNKRVVPLDLFPTGLLDNIVVQKTYTPDMEGDFGGGVVSINTKEYAGRPLLVNSLALGISPPLENSMSYAGGSWDWLGVDDGTRGLPDPIQEQGADKRIHPSNFTPDELAAFGKSFENVWTPTTGTSRPYFKYSGLGAFKIDLGSRPLGIVASASLSNDFDSRDEHRINYEGSEVLTPRTDYAIRSSTASVLGGLTGNLSFKTSDTNSLKLNVLYTRSAEDRTTITNGPNNDQGSIIRSTGLQYVQRGLLSTVLTSSHPLQLEGAVIDWNVSYSSAERDEPDRRESVYSQDENGTYTLSRRETYPLTRIFGESQEYDAAAKASVLLPITTRAAFDTKFKVGLALRNRNRTSSYRRFGFTSRRSPSQNAVDRTQTPESILSESNLDSRFFMLEETTKPQDRYHATHSILGTFALADLRIAQDVRLVAGARIEQSSMAVVTDSPYGPTRDASEVVLEDSDVLPAYNLTWTPRKNMNLRAGYSQTLARPELRELSPFSMYNFEMGYSEVGDTALVETHLRNYDVRWEIFPTRSELAAVSWFYKDLDRPIEKYVRGSAGGYELGPVNGLDGFLRGVELEARIGLGSPLHWFSGRSSAFLDRWGVSANYSRVESAVRLPTPRGIVSTPLNGQSDRTLNLGLFYATKRVDGALLYKTFGPRLSSFGLGEMPDIYEHPIRALDLTFGWQAKPSFRVKFAAENLLDEAVEYRQGPYVTHRWTPGRKVGFSFNYTTGGNDG